MKNPFVYGTIVTDDNFAGREEELSRLHHIIELGESAVIHSPVGMGKSSLLAELARRHSDDFDFVYIDLTGIADETSLVNAIAQETMMGVYGSIERFPAAAWELLSNPKLKRAILESNAFGNGRRLGATQMRISLAKGAVRRSDHIGAERGIGFRICPKCEKPMKWIEKYERHYCYNCKDYAPIRRTLRSPRARMPRPDDPQCPRCNGRLEYVYRYADYYCGECKRYPMLEARRRHVENTSVADIADALDLPQRCAHQRKTRVVMMLDEFQELASIRNRELLDTLSQKCEDHASVSYIFTGSNALQLSRMFRERESPFHNLTHWIDLGPVPDGTLERFLLERFRSAGGNLSKEVASLIIGATGGYPSYVQMIGYEAYHNSASPSVKSVGEAINTVLMKRSEVYSVLWSTIRSPIHRRYLLAAANEPRVPRGVDFVRRHGLMTRSHVQRTEKQLEARGIISRGELVDPMFVLWLRSHATG